MRGIFTNRTIGMTSFPIGTNPTIGTNGPSVWRIVSACVYWTCVGALSGGGGEVFDPNEFCFCSITRNETENNLIGSIRKHTGHLHGFLSRATVKYWKVKMKGGGGGEGVEGRLRSILSVFFNFIKCIFSGLLSIQSKATEALCPLLLCLRHIWFEFGEK